ncbi:Frataxin, mitochondrial [Candida viswanathii]|uniref:ferroxidase n=1 Tax=Candida viswanathii TaxID=5486 RepID=A0A367XSL1_9ASCO|nr:Frataxin, mitochondrial [Candida viswanathii]
MFRRLAFTTARSVTPLVSKQLFTTLIPSIVRTPSVAHSFATARRAYSISTQGEIVDGKIDNISDNEYSNIADEYLENLSDSLEELNETFEQVDAELSHGVLTLNLPPHGTYVINKQPPNKQIWLSSPISGPKRYDLIGGKWITLRDGSSLTELLQEEITLAVGQDFKFEGVEQ